MEKLITRSFLHNWQRKCVALFSAIILWFVVNHSITEQKSIPHVPIRIVNLPPGKTIKGLLPNGTLDTRITLTLSGTKDVIKHLEPGDLEVVIDASHQQNDEWIVQLTKKNIVSLNPDINLAHHISQIAHREFILKISPLITAKIPVKINQMQGNPPEGYEFLDVWPKQLLHVVTGPEEQVKDLKNKGIKVTFDLSEISKGDLEAARRAHSHRLYEDEVSFMVPAKWKQISLPFYPNLFEEINDPNGYHLRIDFLKKEVHPIRQHIPIRLFFPSDTLAAMNPTTLFLEPNEFIINQDGDTLLKAELAVSGVSRRFLNIVANHLEIDIVASENEESLNWSVEIIDLPTLMTAYVDSFKEEIGKKKVSAVNNIQVEEHWKQRFYEYARRLRLHMRHGGSLNLKCKRLGNKVSVKIEPA